MQTPSLVEHSLRCEQVTSGAIMDAAADVSVCIVTTICQTPTAKPGFTAFAGERKTAVEVYEHCMAPWAFEAQQIFLDVALGDVNFALLHTEYLLQQRPAP